MTGKSRPSPESSSGRTVHLSGGFMCFYNNLLNSEDYQKSEITINPSHSHFDSFLIMKNSQVVKIVSAKPIYKASFTTK